MAAIDNFSFLVDEILEKLNHWRDVLAVAGLAVVVGHALKLTYRLLDSIKIHFLAKLSERNLVKVYGNWAGPCSFCLYDCKIAIVSFPIDQFIMFK